MRVCLMIEGQDGVTWDEWTAIASACEQAGLEALFRSDHYLGDDPEAGSLDAWATIAALAAVTQRIRLGALVSPVTFRHPSVLAKMAVTADHVSGGRVEVGMGAGWMEEEHDAYGFAFPHDSARMDMLEEQLEIVRRSWEEGAFDFDGARYRIAGLDARPKPVQPRMPLIVGGSGGRRSGRLAARFADEYNTIFATPRTCRDRRRRVERGFEDEGRDPAGLTFSLMTGFLIGEDRDEVVQRARRAMAHRGEPGDAETWVADKARDWVVGTPGEGRARLGELEAAGVDRVMLQHQDHRDVEAIGLLGEIATWAA